MEQDELEKRIVWLDSERQKDSKKIIELTDLVNALSEKNSKHENRFSLLETEFKSLKKIASRAEKVDGDFAEYKNEILKKITETEKKISLSEQKVQKQRKEDVNVINKQILEYQTDVKAVSEIKKTLQLRSEEALRFNQKLDEISQYFSELKNSDDDFQRQIRALINDFSIESKRLTDLQLEISAMRKRIEGERNQSDLSKEMIRKLESRINEIENTENERRQNQTTFIEKQNLLQVERENMWKEWNKTFNELDDLGKNFNAQLLDLEETHREVKRAQKEFEEINERFNRRINEITEMNRLSEERYRQEWVAFKADDQKRWTNYTLSREEEQREQERQSSRIIDRIMALEDLTQDLTDTLHIVNEETQKQMRGLLTLTQDMLDSYSQSVAKRTR
jgi:chromosome segregation ATPase